MSEVLLISDPLECGLGEGPGCCAFLVAGPVGFMCGRTVAGIPEQIRARLDADTMNAKYDPGEIPYPDCQPERKSTE